MGVSSVEVGLAIHYWPWQSRCFEDGEPQDHHAPLVVQKATFGEKIWYHYEPVKMI
jgi:hypothetical protein